MVLRTLLRVAYSSGMVFSLWDGGWAALVKWAGHGTLARL